MMSDDKFLADPDAPNHERFSELDAQAYGLTRDKLRRIVDRADVMGPDYPSETFRVLKENESPPRRIPHPPLRPRSLGPHGGGRRVQGAGDVVAWLTSTANSLKMDGLT